MSQQKPPIKVNYYRGETVESSHIVHCMIMDRDGNTIGSWGNEDRLISPRSTLKALQAIPFVESGAVDAFGLGEEEIALACASHNAEKTHMDKVAAWLDKIGLSENDLQCGGHLSLSRERRHEMIRNDEKMNGLHSDCSGKHAGMLSAAVHIGAPIENYLDLEHPVQKQIYKTISEMADYDLGSTASGTDGCSAPNPAIPLKNLALAFSRMLNLDALSPERAAACKRILDAKAKHPYLVAGKQRFDTTMMEVTNGKTLCKVGAEGNQMALIPDQGIAIYIKTEDGTVDRAALPVLGKILNDLDAIDKDASKAVEKYINPVPKNWKKVPVGKVEVEGLNF
ncbi:MAG: asparaginase [Alphaproteobacteria bacterium]|nr:asparaginase [Alphaproteobacteria bacterium]